MSKTPYIAAESPSIGAAQIHIARQMSDQDTKREGEILRQLRESRGLTRREVAQKLDITEKSIYAHETGLHTIKKVFLMAYLTVYQVDEKEFSKKLEETT